MDPASLLLGILVPALVAALVLTIGWKLSDAAARRERSAPAPAAAIAISVATGAGFCWLNGWQPKPAESYLWMLWVFPAAALLGGIEARAGTSFLTGALLRSALVVIATLLVMRKSIFHPGAGLDYNRLAFYIGSPLVAISLWRSVLPFLGAVTAAFALWMVSTGLTALLLFASSLKHAQAGAALAGSLGALVVACWLRPSAAGAMGAITPVAVILSTLAFHSIEYASAEYSPWLFALVAVAPVLGVLPFASRSWMKLALIAVPIAIAVGLAFSTYGTSAL